MKAVRISTLEVGVKIIDVSGVYVVRRAVFAKFIHSVENIFAKELTVYYDGFIPFLVSKYLFLCCGAGSEGLFVHVNLKAHGWWSFDCCS